MGKYKEHPKYNVVSIRVSDEERAILAEISRRDRITVTGIMRAAIATYTSLKEVRLNHG